MIITIDGPMASGKTTLARLLARALGGSYVCLSSGLLYRGITYALLKEYGSAGEERTLADYVHALRSMAYTVDGEGRPIVYVCRQDVTALLKTPAMDEATVQVSARPVVRELLLGFQRAYAHEHPDLVLEGRDAGTVVFPDAVCKLFITSSLEVRAQRWQADQARQGIFLTEEESCAHVLERDTKDRDRPISPLRPAPDAWYCDTTDATLNQAVQRLKEYVYVCMNKG